MAERFEPRLECLKNMLLREIGQLFAEALEVAEGMLINEADEAEEFEQRVLQRRGREQQLVFVGERQLQRVRDDVGWLIDIPQTVGFVHYHEIPRSIGNIGGFVSRKLVRADDDVVAFERAKYALSDCGVIGL